MGNRKPRSAVDRLPTDFEQPRRRSVEERNDWGAMLQPLGIGDDTRWESMQAVTYVHKELRLIDEDGVREVALALGLDELHTPKPADIDTTAFVPTRPLDIACPRCDAQPGQRCRSVRQREVSYHVQRQGRVDGRRKEAA